MDMNARGQTICLNMVVKNEAAVIRRCLDSALPFIDSWVIVDTGSIDETPQIIRDTLRGIPGELHERQWTNFGHNRNQALDLARGHGHYLLLIDADEVLEPALDFALPPLAADSYKLQISHAGCCYLRTLLVRNDLPWRYHGVLHEYIACERARTEAFLDGLVCVSFHDGARAQDPSTYRRDALRLEQALLEEPGNSRYVFYLAQSYRDAGDFELALRYYRRRVEMGGWKEEVWYSLYQIARVHEQMEAAWEETMGSYLAAWQHTPSRAEPLFRIAMHYQTRQEFPLAHLFLERAIQISPPDAACLFVERSLYDYHMLLEYAVACYYLGQNDDAIAANNRLLRSGTLPPQFVEQVIRNRRFSLDSLWPQRHSFALPPKLHVYVAFCDPGPELDDCIEGLRRQECESLTVTLIDEDSHADHTARVPTDDQRFSLVSSGGPANRLSWIAEMARDYHDPENVFVMLLPTDRLADHQALKRIQAVFHDPDCLLAYGQYRLASGESGCAEPAPSEAIFLERAAQLAGAAAIAVRARLLQQSSVHQLKDYDSLFRAAGFKHTRFSDDTWTEQSVPCSLSPASSCGTQTKTPVESAAMVSCLMVTLDRLALAKHAIRSYAAQNYPNRELVIVADGEERYRRALARYVEALGIARVRIVYPGTGGLTLGALRNISMEAAQGEIICQWDDDDYSHPERLDVQVRDMIAHRAGASFLTDHLQYFEPERLLSWIDWSGEGHYDGVSQLAPGTLMTYRDARFRYPESGPDARKGEDYVFMEALYAAMPVSPLNGVGDLYLYRYHGRNTFSSEHHHRLNACRSCSNAKMLQNAGRLRRALRYYPIARPCSVVGREGPVFVLN
jgi:glycosyltransferase involved in cell wall biosynthesis